MMTPFMKGYYNSSSTKNLILEPAVIEYITAKNLNGKRVGEGNGGIDVISNGIGVDTFCVCIKGNQSGEKSIGQNFKDSDTDKVQINNLFEENKICQAINLYKQIIYKKLCKAKKKHKLTNLYYLGFISTNEKIYISAFKLNLNAIYNIEKIGLTKRGKSINFRNCIDSEYGNTKLYKSKVRLELRLTKKILNCINTLEILNIITC
jgi:hypothetical protein